MSNKAALVIMAAGIGSRYGGNKQVDGIGPHGEMLMEYSVFDAVKAGFDQIVFIIRPEMEHTLRNLFGDRIAKQVQVSYAHQTFESLPVFYSVAPERKKPFGTVHALLSAKEYVNTPFAVINADDYYGVEAFNTMFKALMELPTFNAACMMGYRLRNTLSENGTVTRAVCKVENEKLVEVKEYKGISRLANGMIQETHTETILDPDELVSMNFWGFSPWVFDVVQWYFENFLYGLPQNELKAECLLPTMVGDMIGSKNLCVRVLSADSQWYGVTYKEDKFKVQAKLKNLHDAGIYPTVLF